MVKGGREGRTGRGRGKGGMAAGGGGSSGAGKETAGATTLSDLNNFQFQEGKRELEKYRRCDLAEGREEAPKGSRVCDGASLDTAKKAENAGRGEWGRHCVARRAPQKAALAGRGGRARAGSAEAEGPAGAKPPPLLSQAGLHRLRLGAPGSPGGAPLLPSAFTPSAGAQRLASGRLAPRHLGRSLEDFCLRIPFQFS